MKFYHSLFILFLIPIGCGGDSGMNNERINNESGNGGEETLPISNSVDVVDFAFIVANIQTLGGSTVVWTWKGSSLHTVTFDDGQISSSGAAKTSGTHNAQMPTVPGTYAYKCTVHPSVMNGTVKVE